MKLTIETSNIEDLEKALRTLVVSLEEKAKGHIHANYSWLEKNGRNGKVEVVFYYSGENRATDWIIRKEFEKAVKRIDSFAKIR